MATKGRERTITSSDLDIFGDVPENDSASATDASMDIFGSNEPDTGNEADVSTEGSATDEATETPAAESTEETAEPTAEEATETPATEALEEVEEQDIDIDKLFDDIEEQVKEEGNNELQKLVDTLRSASADQETELMQLRKQNEIMRDKLLSRAGDDAELGIYKPLLDNIEKNRPLKFIATYYSPEMNDKNKERVVSILSDFIQELTGQDVSGLIEKSQTDKINSIAGGQSTTELEKKTDDKPMSFEESTTNLF